MIIAEPGTSVTVGISSCTWWGCPQFWLDFTCLGASSDMGRISEQPNDAHRHIHDILALASQRRRAKQTTCSRSS